MQKQKITYLSLQSSYDQIEIGLFKDQQKIAETQISKFTASSLLIPCIKQLLQDHAILLNNLDFIGANLGPAPFTTLRTTIVTINGISFANKMPLVGINGIELFAKQALPTEHNLIIIWNAFNHSVYFGIRQNQIVTYGWQKIDLFLAQIQKQFKDAPVIMIGHGINHFKPELTTLPNNFILNQTCEQFPKIDLIAQASLEFYLKNQTSKMLTPLYLKQAEPWI